MHPWLHALLFAGLMLIAMLGYMGHEWRRHHIRVSASYEVRRYPCYRPSRTVFIVYDGAFNKASVHWHHLRHDVLRQYGDVYELQYGTERFSCPQAVNVMVHQLGLQRYDRVVIIGASMGAQLAIRTVARMNDRFVSLNPRANIYLIGVDPTLSGTVLRPRLQLLAWFSSKLQTGPVWNKLLAWTNRLTFRSLPKRLCEAKMSQDLLQQHLRQRRAYTASVISDMNAAILQGTTSLPDWMRPSGLQVGCLFSDQDTVLDGEAARQQWRELFPQSLDVAVPQGHHVDLIENPTAWRQAFEQLFTELSLIAQPTPR